MNAPEQQARAEIDRLLGAAGWAVPSIDGVNLHAAQGVANNGREGEAEVEANLKRAQVSRKAAIRRAFTGSQSCTSIGGSHELPN